MEIARDIKFRQELNTTHTARNTLRTHCEQHNKFNAKIQKKIKVNFKVFTYIRSLSATDFLFYVAYKIYISVLKTYKILPLFGPI